MWCNSLEEKRNYYLYFSYAALSKDGQMEMTDEAVICYCRVVSISIFSEV